MEINVENEKNEEDKGYLNLFHKGDVIVHDQHYYLIVAIDKDDDRFPLSVSQLDGLDGLDVNQYLWGSLPENPEEKSKPETLKEQKENFHHFLQILDHALKVRAFSKSSIPFLSR